MRKPSLALLDIALECGFANEAHFSHTFLQHFGLPPAVPPRKVLPNRFVRTCAVAYLDTVHHMDEDVLTCPISNPTSTAISTPFAASPLSRSAILTPRRICLVQFKQRSGDGFVVRFRSVCDRGFAFWLTVHTVHFARNSVISGRNMETGEGMDSKKRQ